MANILKGLPVAKKINEDTLSNIEILKTKNVIPKLSIIRVGEKSDDIYYENAAVKKCGQFGIEVQCMHFDNTVTQAELESAIESCNKDNLTYGILILRPLPKHIDDKKISSLIDPQKDIDGISPYSLYNVFAGGDDGFVPCTARACLEILKFYNISLEGKKSVIIGRSLVIGKPVSMLLLKENSTVTICHSKTSDLKDITRNADIIITSAGKIGTIKAENVSAGQTVIDVSMNTDSDGKMCGDADFDTVSKIVENITPVPGGVGTMTTAILLNNVTKAALALI